MQQKALFSSELMPACYAASEHQRDTTATHLFHGTSVVQHSLQAYC